jgi:hypothetical protein
MSMPTGDTCLSLMPPEPLIDHWGADCRAFSRATRVDKVLLMLLTKARLSLLTRAKPVLLMLLWSNKRAHRDMKVDRVKMTKDQNMSRHSIH